MISCDLSKTVWRLCMVNGDTEVLRGWVKKHLVAGVDERRK